MENIQSINSIKRNAEHGIVFGAAALLLMAQVALAVTLAVNHARPSLPEQDPLQVPPAAVELNQQGSLSSAVAAEFSANSGAGGSTGMVGTSD